MNDKIIEKVVFLIVAFYLGTALWLVKDYGITIDEPQHFAVGEKYFHFYRSGYLNFQDDIPQIADHPNFYNRQLQLRPYIMPPFANIMSAAGCYLLFQKLRLFDPISAHHLVIPLFTAFFIYILYCFVKIHWDSFSGLITVLALITYPRFFGHSFNNIKDIPEIVLFSLTIIMFAEWVIGRRMKFLYLAFLSWGFALATKMDALLIPVILFLWQLPTLYMCLREKDFFKPRMFLHFLCGSLLTILVFILSYPPLLTSQSGGRGKFIAGIIRYIHSIGTNPNISWNLYAPSQILYVTPAVMLIMFAVGFGGILKKPSNNLNLLLIIWLLFPVLRHCLPGANHYDGLRHFLVFIVPFAIILSLGAVRLSEFKPQFLGKLKKEWRLIVLAIFLATPNLYALVTIHPFQTTYYNFLVGGLKGAQDKGIPYAGDYWLNSYRKGWEWLEKNAKTGSGYYAYPDGSLFNFHLQRDDLKPVTVGKISFPPQKYLTIPRNTYVVVVPRKWLRMSKRMHLSEILSIVDELKVVYQIKRQKGDILTIYYVDEKVGGNKNVAVFVLSS